MSRMRLPLRPCGLRAGRTRSRQAGPSRSRPDLRSCGADHDETLHGKLRRRQEFDRSLGLAFEIGSVGRLGDEVPSLRVHRLEGRAHGMIGAHENGSVAFRIGGERGKRNVERRRHELKVLLELGSNGSIGWNACPLTVTLHQGQQGAFEIRPAETRRAVLGGETAFCAGNVDA